MVGLMPGFPRTTPEDMNMNEQSVKRFGDAVEEKGCCLCCRLRWWCVRRRRRQLKSFLDDLLVLDALNDVAYDSAQRMVGG